MPSIRRNAKYLTADDKKRYIAAIQHMKNTKRTLPSGKSAPVSIFDEYAVIHRAIMMLILKDGTKQPIGHNCASFLPWHRAFLKAFEDDLQSFDHEITLIWWDWTDPESTAALLSDDFLGAPHGGPITGPLAGWKLAIDNTILQRDPGDFDDLSQQTVEALALIQRTPDNYEAFETSLESFHNFVHVWAGGHMQNVGTAANDPIFYLHHTNVDRIWSLWQDYGHLKSFSTFFSKQGGYQESGNRLGSLLWPWDGGYAHAEADALRNAVAHRIVGGEKAITNGSELDYRLLRTGYDKIGGSVSIPGTVDSTINTLSSVFFTFDVPPELSGGNFTFETAGTADLEMELYGPALCDNCYGDQRAYDDNSGAGGVNPRIVLTLKNGHYSIIVRPHNPTDQLDNVPFTLKTSVGNTTTAPPDTGKGHLLTVGVVFKASISAHGEVDWYHFTIDQDSSVVIETRGQLDTVLVLYGSAPPKGIITWDDNSGQGGNASIKKQLKAGLYHLAIRTSSNQIGTYTIEVRV